ncbi:hypothetical protein N7522_003995 [Penicillium canescens]|nr:uncharacterized protein N7446_005616 [Penicillium canescens]KAJ6008979.1 hypothetical protein N7522_003995 [Penicillium canescens]KAJ6050139.1 hypothetical protein N7444_006855 [Penicillium canescens]KAJ6050988.1 hypothetical protein N7460_001522 [Penicillium canescens]KAJ6061496.1 hypothetical protein N7446_005616 [Penicillium canescens]
MDYNHGLSNNPFLEVDGAFNFRGVGGYRSTLSPDAVIREGLIYRTGHLSDVTSAGWHTVKSLGVSTIIDMTSPGEVEIFTGAPDKTLSPLGIETLHLPLKQGVFSMARQVRKYQVYRSTGPEVIAEGYLNLLEVGSAIIRRVLEHFRDNAGGCLIHCAMGKDRTGVIVGLLLSLAGVPHDTIADEFSLSEAHLEHLQPRIADIVESIDPNEEDPLGIAKMATECRRDVMALTLQCVDERYGGIGQYAQDHCGFLAEEIARIRQNMLCPKIMR